MESNSKVTNHWENYQHQVKKYLDAVVTNPYHLELVNDFREEKINRVVNNFSDPFKMYVRKKLEQGIIDENWFNTINSNFIDRSSMDMFCKYLEGSLNDNDDIDLKNVAQNIDKIKDKIGSDMPKIEFNPTELKFVTTTGIAYLDTGVDYTYLYKKFTPPQNVVKHSGNNKTIFNDHIINTVVGCKTGNKPVKGYFKKEQRDFFNCATLNIVLTNTKCANVKLFGNGKLQLTGIPSPELGLKTIDIIISLIKNIKDDMETNTKIVFDKKRVTLQKYNTVMINTCYELGIGINRDILYDIITNRYGLSAIYESDGYPGVRVEYFYNEKFDNNGKCTCSPCCNGKSDENSEACKRLSIAIFQSGSVIIAGGCKNIDPINKAYTLINKIIGEIIHEIRKIDNTKKKKLKKRNEVVYLQKQAGNNLTEEQYKKLLQLKL